MGLQRNGTRRPAAEERRPDVMRAPVAARKAHANATLQQRLGNGGTLALGAQVISRQPAPTPSTAPSPPPMVAAPVDPETALVDELADYLLQMPNVIDALEISKGTARQLKTTVEKSKTDEDDDLKQRLAALDKKTRARVAAAALAQVQGALVERRADKLDELAADIVTRTQVRFAALAEVARGKELAEEDEFKDPKKKGKRRPQFALIRKYIVKDTIAPQIDKPRAKPYALRADYRAPLDLAEGDVLFPDLHEEGFVDELKKLPASMRKPLKDEVDKQTLLVLADYIQERMQTVPATILAEWAREFDTLDERIRGNMEEKLNGWFAVRKEMLNVFGSPDNVPATIAAMNDYFRNEMEPCTYLKGVKGEGNTIVHKELNKALAQAEKFMDDPTRKWREEVVKSVKSYWATNIRENRNAPARPSEHTYGWALDISAGDNPNLAQLLPADWDFISEMVGERVIYEPGSTKAKPLYTESAKALRAPASDGSKMLAGMTKIRKQSAGLAATFANDTSLRARLRAILAASPAGKGKKPEEIDAMLDFARNATTGPGKDRQLAYKSLKATLEAETFKQEPIASEPEGAASKVREKLVKLLAPNLRKLDKVTEAESAIRAQIVTPADRATADARKHNVGVLFTKSLVKELNAVPAVDRPELARQVLRDLRVPIVRKRTDAAARSLAALLKRAFDVLDKTVDKKTGAKVGTGAGMANIAVHGFSNLNEKLVVSLVHPSGGNLNWLGVVNQDMHHFQLRNLPKITKVPAPVPMPLPQPTTPPGPAPTTGASPPATIIDPWAPL